MYSPDSNGSFVNSKQNVLTKQNNKILSTLQFFCLCIVSGSLSQLKKCIFLLFAVYATQIAAHVGPPPVARSTSISLCIVLPKEAVPSDVTTAPSSVYVVQYKPPRPARSSLRSSRHRFGLALPPLPLRSHEQQQHGCRWRPQSMGGAATLHCGRMFALGMRLQKRRR